MKYVFHPAALTEYGEAVGFYAERRVALAQAFNENSDRTLLNPLLNGSDTATM